MLYCVFIVSRRSCVCACYFRAEWKIVVGKSWLFSQEVRRCSPCFVSNAMFHKVCPLNHLSFHLLLMSGLDIRLEILLCVSWVSCFFRFGSEKWPRFVKRKNVLTVVPVGAVYFLSQTLSLLPGSFARFLAFRQMGRSTLPLKNKLTS